MLLQPFSSELYQAGEEYQLGAPVEVYKRYATLSGKIAFTGILLLALSLIGLSTQFFISGSTRSSSLVIAWPGLCQCIFVFGNLLSMIRHEELITPWHPRLSVTVYTEGLLYRKGRRIQIIRWEQIQNMQRQFKIYRRGKKREIVRPAYLCEVTEQLDLKLSASIPDVEELGSCIERELTRRLLPQVQADYQADKLVSFSHLVLSRQAAIHSYQKGVAWERVSSVEFGPEKLVIEKDGVHAEWLTIPLADVANVCVLEALLQDIQQERGFVLSLAVGEKKQDSAPIEVFRTERHVRYPRKTSWISTVALVILALLVIGAEIINVIASFQSSQQQSIAQYYPPPNSYSLHPTPLPGLPYSAETVYKAFRAAGIEAKDVTYADEWQSDVATYPPEGKMVSWGASYALMVTIATFATPFEAKTDASELLNHSAGFSVYTRNLCLLFYDSSISDDHIVAFKAVMARVCK